MKNFEQICERLKQARLDKGLTLREVEKRSGISFSMVSQIENRRHASFSLDNLLRLAAAYEVPVSSLIEDDATSEAESTDERASIGGVREEILNPPSEHKKVKVALLRMDAKSEVSWKPVSGTLYVYLTSGKVQVVREGAEPQVLDEGGSCNCEITGAARIQALESSCVYLTRVREMSREAVAETTPACAPETVKRVKSLEEENARLKRLVADLMLDNQAMKDAATPKI